MKSDFFANFVHFSQGFVTGGKDGVVVVWDMFFEHCLKAFRVERAVMNYGSILLDDTPPIRSIHTNATRILIGTGNDEVIEIEEDGKMTIIAQVCIIRYSAMISP